MESAKPVQKTSTRLNIAIALLLFAAAVGTGIFIKEHYDEWFVYPGLRAQLSSQMRDPASTQFKNEKLATNGALCGDYNTKNGYGAYTGFKRFVAGYRTVYTEDMGRLGVSDSGEAIIENLDEQNAILKNRNKLQKSGFEMKTLTEGELATLVNASLFEKYWKESCS